MEILKKNALTEADMLTILADAGPGSMVFLSYLAGRKNDSSVAAFEAARAQKEGINLRHYTGTLESVKTTSRGEKLLTLWVSERDSLQPNGMLSPGNYRAFNPSLGQLLTIEVLDPMPNCWMAL